jgi:cob(I)alamin adenosyltransferase
MSIQNGSSDRPVLQQFQEAHPELESVHQITALPEEEFVQTYAPEFAGSVQEARRVYQLAEEIQQHTALLWANLKDVASPFVQNTIFNNIPASFLAHQQSIPGYDRLFGNLDYVDCEPCRSIFGPAAYFVDLMRFIEETITNRNTIPLEHQLNHRRPDLFSLKLDCDNTNALIAYIDLVNEALETMVANLEQPDADATIEAANFPSNLPFNLPLEQIRSYLNQLKLNLSEIYQAFETTLPTKAEAIARESLTLSPREFNIICTELTIPVNVLQYYGLEGTQTLDSLRNVSTFLQQTGLNRQELTDLLFQDLSQEEVNHGLARQFFINQAEDGLDYLQIQEEAPASNSFYQIPQERLVNLSVAKLDRIYRFVKLARKLGWSFADLDWALRSLHPQSQERVLRFDGINDAVTVENVTKLNDLSEFTIEAWIQPSQAQANPILYKGINVDEAVGNDAPRTHFLFGLDADNHLILVSDRHTLQGSVSLPLNQFSHVAVTIAANQVTFYINGKPETLPVHRVTPAALFQVVDLGVSQQVVDRLRGFEEHSYTQEPLLAALRTILTEEEFERYQAEILVATREASLPFLPVGTTLILGADGGSGSFAGILQEVRIWQGIRSEAMIAADRYHRFTGQENRLVAYWALTEEANQLSDRTSNPNHAVRGGAGAMTQPQWVAADLVLEPFPEAIAQTAYAFNGIDQYLAGQNLQGLSINSDTGNQLTLEAWVNLAQSQGNTIFRIGSETATQPEFECGVTASNRFAMLARGSFHQANIVVQPNQLTHIAVTIHGTQVQFYINGQAAGDGTLSTAIAITDTELEIGRNLSGDHFNGQLREVRFWNQARTADQIRQTMHRVLPRRAAGLIGYWRLNQIEAGMAMDGSYNQNHLFLGGIPEDFMPDRIAVDRLLPSPIAITNSILELDGEHHVIVVSNPQNAGLEQHQRFTLELWFKPAEVILPSDRRQVIYSQGDASAGLNIYLLQNELYVIAWCVEPESSIIRETVLRSLVIQGDRWHHVAVTYDTTRSRHFVGFQAYLNDSRLALATSNHPNSNLLPEQKGYRLNPVGVAYLGGIGAEGITRFRGETVSASPLHRFAGQITDVRLWNRIKSEPEIQQERLIAPDPNDVSLISYLPLTEGEGRMLHDRSLHLNHLSQGMLQVDDLVLDGDRIELRNVHSIYNAPEASIWTNYVYTGKLSFTDVNGAIGVSFLNRHSAPEMTAYLLHRTAQQPTFHLTTLPAQNDSLTGVLDSTVNPAINTDYQFRVEVGVSNNQTIIRAKVWQDSEAEPSVWQIDVQDSRGDRPISGTVGIWAAGDGSKFFADLQVERQVVGEAVGISPVQTPANWQDTAAEFSTTPDDSLFGILRDRQNNSFFGTRSTDHHIHSHYNATNALSWNHYIYTGRLRTTHNEGAIGVTFLSQYPANQPRYYRLRAWGQQFPFALETRSAATDPQNAPTPLKGTIVSSVELHNNVWYRFRIEVEDTGLQTNLRAKVWQDGELEPAAWQMDAYDDRLERLSAGTIGVWAANPGSKLYDDLRVFHRTRLLSETPTATDLSLFQTADEPAPAPWITIDDYPLLLHPLNQRALRFDGEQEYLATALTGDRTLNLSPFTIEAWVKQDRLQSNPVLSWQNATEPPQTSWFGVDSQGRLTIASESSSGTSTNFASTTTLETGVFTHIAVSVAGATASFYINGVAEAPVDLSVAIALDAALLELGRASATQYFAGEIQDVRLWKTNRTADQFAAQIRYQQPDPDDPDLVAHWSFPEADGAITQDVSARHIDLRLGGLEAARRPLLISTSDLLIVAQPNPVLALDDAILLELAIIRQLQARHNLPIDRLTALWFEIAHTGHQDGQTLFDRVFNGRGITGDVWNYSQSPIRWNVTEQSRRNREIRSRLMGTLQVSSDDLDRLVRWIDNTATVIELDSLHLNQLYRLAQLPRVLRLTVQDFLRLLTLMNLAEVNTLEVFKQVSDRVDWLQRAGILVAELDFLTRSTFSSQIALPYMEIAIRNLATTLTNQASEFLVTNSTFVSDLVNLAQSTRIFNSLKDAAILDELDDNLAAVSASYQPSLSLPDIELQVSSDLRQMMQIQVKDTLSRLQEEHANAMVERLSELFQTEPERLRSVLDAFNRQADRTITPSDFIRWMRDMVRATDSQPLPADLRNYLYQLSKALYVINRFALTTTEATDLLQNPDHFSVTDVFNPTIADLEHLVMFTELKTAFNDVNAGLIHIFAQPADEAIATAIVDLANWDSEQLTTLTAYFGNASTANRIVELHRLQRAFTLAETLQVDIEFLIQLASTDKLTLEFYRQQSDALLNVVRSRYTDEQWQRVYKPIRDELATQWRDALLSYALPRQLPDTFQGRRDADVLYEYLLLDVQIGSEVDTSRIVQGIAALQLYVQRCLLNLERGVDPGTIPLDQWNWMKNYRVWEANRKVFLYPESYIEPELRDTKTPLFEEFEQELMQSDITQETVEHAFMNYLNKFAEIANLKIVGSYRHRDLNDSNADDVLYLIGRTPAQPRVYYYREYIMPRASQTGRWLPWKQINLPINADIATPVFAFNRLFLFWVEFTESSDSTGEGETIVVYRPTVRFSFLNFTGGWIPPQTYDLGSQTAISLPAIQVVVAATNRALIGLTQAINLVRSATNSAEIDRTDLESILAQTRQAIAQLQGYLTTVQLVLRQTDANVEETEESVNALEASIMELEQEADRLNQANQELIESGLTTSGGITALIPGFIAIIISNILTPVENLSLDAQQRVTALNGQLINLRVQGLSLNRQQRSLVEWQRVYAQPAITSSGQEHLILFYGLNNQVIRTRRNILDAQSLSLNMTSSLQVVEDYDLVLSETSTLFVGRNRMVLGNTFGVTNEPAPQTTLMQLPNGNVALRDVHNQPGWYVLDTGDEQFLLQGQRSNARFQTVAERLQLNFSDNGSPATIQPVSVQFAPDAGISPTTSPLVPNFRFIRLTTFAAHELGNRLFQGGLDALLNPSSQQLPEINFRNYNSNPSLTSNRSDDVIDFDGAYGLYYWEIFFHLPFLVANRLNANQNFADAQRWYHYIFNPTSPSTGNGAAANSNRYWQYLPFQNLTLERLDQILTNEAALADYRRDPFDPHAIARLRVNAYQKAIAMKYIDNLLDWGDNLFNQNTREAIGDATQLYVLAFNLLGPRPEGRVNRRFEEIGDYNGIRAVFDHPPDFLTDLPHARALPVPQNGNILTTFCVTENADFASFWDRVSDRLFNIRHSLNIDGIFRQLPLFQPPLDVRALVAAFASGNRDISSILADVNRPVPHYRYSYMLDRAKEMTEIVIGLGEKLLEALQNRDAEQLATLQNTHERTILGLMTAIRESERNEAQANLAALQISRTNLQNRLDHFTELIEGGTGSAALSDEEVAELTLTGLTQPIKTSVIVPGQLGAAIAKAAPTMVTGAVGVFPLAQVEIDGDQLGALSDGYAAVGAWLVDILETAASLTGKIGEYKRRLNEWQLEQRTAELNLQEIDQQIEIANIQLQIAEQELVVHNRTIQQNQEIADFYRRKFTNEQLYNWMISRISGLYFQAYKLAYATAKDAERAFQYEFGDNSQFINFGHWDSLRRGLLAGESLQLDLMRLEKYAIDQDSRYQEIEKIISLRSLLSQEAFTMFRDTGNCFFNLTEQMFDEDYPGHFFRVIKSIALTVKSAGLNPDQSLNATLIQLNNRALLEPDIEGVRYLIDGASQTDDIPASIRSNWRTNQQIAVSRPSRDNGMFGNFDLNFLFDDRYFPFEGTGAVSSWELEMPQARQFLTNNESDILIHLKYTSRSDRGRFRTEVQEALRRNA